MLPNGICNFSDPVKGSRMAGVEGPGGATARGRGEDRRVRTTPGVGTVAGAGVGIGAEGRDPPAPAGQQRKLAKRVRERIRLGRL